MPPTGPTPEEIAAKKARQKEKNKRLALKRKEKKAKKKKEAEEAKSAADAGRQTPPLPPLTASSSSEEDSPRKSPVRSRTYRVLGDTAKKSLYQKLNTISEDELEQLGEEIERCYRAKTASDGNDDTAVIFADLHSKLVGGKKSKEVAVMDSGCTRDIVSQDIVMDLGL